MKRKVFHTFRYETDCRRVQQIKNMGVVESQPLLYSNEWEKIRQGGGEAIKKWINEQMRGKSCQVVLIGSGTAGRKWVNYEIEKAWNDRKGVVGIYIHKLKDLNGKQAVKGRNPFDDFKVGPETLSSIVKSYDPGGPLATSKIVYDLIKSNLVDWVEEAIEIRNRF